MTKKEDEFRAQQKAALEAYDLPLEPGHDCRRDDPVLYETVSDWYRHHHGKVPSIMAVELGKRMKTTGETFGQAYTALLNRGSIILIAEATEPPKPI
jgi:hypothetical protein